MPVPVARPGKITSHNAVSGMEPDQFGDDLIVKQIGDVSFILFGKTGLPALWVVVTGHRFYLVGPGMSMDMQELPEAQDRVVSLGFSPAPRAMT